MTAGPIPFAVPVPKKRVAVFLSGHKLVWVSHWRDVPGVCPLTYGAAWDIGNSFIYPESYGGRKRGTEAEWF